MQKRRIEVEIGRKPDFAKGNSIHLLAVLLTIHSYDEENSIHHVKSLYELLY